MIETVERLADIAVLRSCIFAMAAIFALMLRMTDDPGAALSAGGELALLLCSTLAAAAHWAPRLAYARTPVWDMLKASERPSPLVAQRVIGSSLRRACLNHALHSATAALALLGTSLGISAASLVA